MDGGVVGWMNGPPPPRLVLLGVSGGSGSVPVKPLEIVLIVTDAVSVKL